MSVHNNIRQDDKTAYISLTWENEPGEDVTPSPYFRFKGIIDRILTVALLVPGLPLTALLVLLVRLTSRGPGIYSQARVGKDGRTFKMYKIRTMRVDAEAKSGAVWTQANDPRITRIGRLLRKLHLDEFPQLLNVLRGEMSLIGPRPERPEFVQLLAKEIPGYLDRIKVRPGITGLAQINLPPDTDLDSVRRKLVLDLEYVARAGFFIDVRMFLCTFIRLLGFSGEMAIRIIRLRREVPHLAGRIRQVDGPSQSIAAPAGVVADRNTNGKASRNGRIHANGKSKTSAAPKPR